MNINDRVQSKTQPAKTGTIKDTRLSPIFTILWDNPSEDDNQLLEGEFKVVTPGDVANDLIAMSNGNFKDVDLLPAMRHLLYWNDPQLLIAAFRLIYDLGLAEGQRQARETANLENELAITRIKTLRLAEFK